MDAVCSRSRTAVALDGSTSTTVTTASSPPDNLPAAGTLRLRGRHEVVDGTVKSSEKGKGKAKEGEDEAEGEAKSDRVTWVEGTVDNEFLGRKSSKSALACLPVCFDLESQR